MGQVIEISAPRNFFRLYETAGHSVLLAGGIGITPIYAMLQHLLDLGSSVELISCARNRDEAAYIENIKALTKHTATSRTPITVRYHFDGGKGGPPDLMHFLGGRPLGTHFYYCGPGTMLDAYEKACDALDQVHVQLERFSAARDD